MNNHEDQGRLSVIQLDGTEHILGDAAVVIGGKLVVEGVANTAEVRNS